MANKEIIIVYQDCFMCGGRENWSAKAKKAAEQLEKAGASFRKLSFASIEGQNHCAKAIEAGVGAMPFYTDGKIYASDLETLLEAESKAQNERDEVEPHTAKVKVTKRTKKTKEQKDGLAD